MLMTPVLNVVMWTNNAEHTRSNYLPCRKHILRCNVCMYGVNTNASRAQHGKWFLMFFDFV